MSMNMNPNSNNNSNIAMYRFMAAYMNKLQRNMANGGGGGGGNSGNVNNVPSSQSSGGFYNEQNGEIDFVNPTGSGGSWRGMNGGGGPQHDNIIPNMANGFMGGNNSFMSSASSAANFKCPECGLTKGTCHELEVHIKTEHLNWLPFQCPMCTAVRATDTQMHEHVHSHHKKNDNKYIYLDNPPAKRMLQTMLDRALMGAAVSIARKLPSQQNSAPINSAPAQNPSYMNGFMSNGVDRGFKRPRLNMNFNEDGDVSGNFADNERSATHSPGDSDNAVEKIGHRASATVTVVPKKGPSAADAMLAQLQAQAASGHVEDGSIDNDEPTTRHPRSITEGTGNPDDEMFDNTLDNVDDETSAQLAHIFGKALPKSEFDEMDGDSTKDMDSTGGGDLLGNLTNMFSGHKQEYEQLTKRKRAPRGSKGGVGSLSKKRVLGECSKCHKPVTAGARQMHMFFHLGKDFNTYRFRCKFPDCTIEHYRKDQMENHHSKQHGRIDADMMEDRSFELHNMVQELSMELLGTTGNTPGPTAAKAQLVYDAMQKEAAALANAKKRRRVNYHDFLGIRSQYHSSNYSPPTMVKTSSPLTQLSNPTPTNGGSKLPLVKSNSGSFVEDDVIQDYDYADLVDSKVDLKRLERSEAIKRMRANEEEIACQLCGKKLMNRVSETQDKEMLEKIVDKIRGFHILWHLSNDLGIIRYSCKFCDFKHERPQSVSTHGKKEHGDEECVEDSLYKYEDEVKSMSKACFGIEQLFAKEVRRRNRVEREAAIAMAEEEYNNSISLFDEEAEAAEAAEADENEDSQDATDIMEKFAIKYSLPKPNSSSSNAVVNKSSNSGSGSAKKKVSKRRFGHRRPMNRKKKEDMVKLRAISFKIGGAQYFKKKINEAGHCEKCGKSTPSRMTHHAYSHLDDCQLFCCPHCNLGNWSRDLVLRHIKDFHNSAKAPIDNRLKYAQEIKDSIKECYPSYFVDAPIPTPVDIENLKKSLNLEDITLAGVNDEEENEEHVGEIVNEDEESNSVADESEQVEDEQGEEEKEEEQQEDNIDEEEEEDGAICEDD